MSPSTAALQKEGYGLRAANVGRTANFSSLQIDQHNNPEESIDTPFDRYKFTLIKSAHAKAVAITPPQRQFSHCIWVGHFPGQQGFYHCQRARSLRFGSLWQLAPWPWTPPPPDHLTPRNILCAQILDSGFITPVAVLSSADVVRASLTGYISP